MRSEYLDLSHYDTDKITNSYLDKYDPILKPWLDKKITLLELGVYKGGSLRLWRDYFQKATIVGIDCRLPANTDFGDRIVLYQGYQQNVTFLSDVSNQVASDGFDIIIDDASHIGYLTKISFWHLFDNHLKPGGLYVIEDWGTGYWWDWIDGRVPKETTSFFARTWCHIQTMWQFTRKIPLKIPIRSHDYGMVGFIKELIDEQGAEDLTRRSIKGRSTRKSKFENMIISPSIVFVKKAHAEEKI